MNAENRASSFNHPTGNDNVESVAIVALGPTNADYHRAMIPHEPAIPEVDEVWAINTGVRSTRADLVFIMDDLETMARKSGRYRTDLAALEVPIITSELDETTRRINLDAIQYPLADVMEWWGRRFLDQRGGEWNNSSYQAAGLEIASYLHNSIPYVLAYAAFIGVRNIYLFGADYTFPGMAAREDDRANAEYWVGMVRGAGVRVLVPERTTLLNTQRGRWFYGFARQPNLWGS